MAFFKKTKCKGCGTEIKIFKKISIFLSGCCACSFIGAVLEDGREVIVCSKCGKYCATLERVKKERNEKL